MPFVDAAHAAVAALPRTDPTSIVLKFLLARAVGRENAVPWPQIRNHLRLKGHVVGKSAFQQGVLKQTRESAVFIASSNRGYFLINDADDAGAMRDFYEDRIAKERARLKHLRRLAGENDWVV
jgi:hypothetical protein